MRGQLLNDNQEGRVVIRRSCINICDKMIVQVQRYHNYYVVHISMTAQHLVFLDSI